MSVNPTLNYLKSEQSLVMMCFSESVTTSDKYLKGAGGIGDDGFPLPLGGTLEGLQVHDGTDTESDDKSIPFSAGDRISIYAVHDVNIFIVYVRINGINTTLSASPLAENTNLLATVTVRLTE
ncbi:MAG: hypothetical protein H8E46_10945 [FCB group bacterium]|nr:hypothetical protein [FCB group bacterium]